MTRMSSNPERGLWFAAAAYGERDCGDGFTRLFTKLYDHEPDEREIRCDAFVEAVPDWQQRYPHYEVEAASYEWEGTLHDALTISVIPAAALCTRLTAPADVLPVEAVSHDG